MLAYHFTNPANVESILANGLIANFKEGIYCSSYYNKNFIYDKAVYIALPECDFDYLFGDTWNGEREILTVDITGLVLWPDLNSLGDFSNAHRNKSFDKDEVHPSSKLGREIINLTKTAVVLHDIRPERISL